MRKRYPNLIRILVALAMVGGLLGVVVSTGGAQVEQGMDEPHYSHGQTITVTVIDLSMVNGAAGDTLGVNMISTEEPAALPEPLTVDEVDPETWDPVTKR